MEEIHFKEILKAQARSIAQGASMGEVVADLHNTALTILQTMKMVKDLYGISLRDAQQYVLAHPSWVKEAKNVILFEDIMGVVAADLAYYQWLEWYISGVHTLGMFRSVSPRGQAWEESIIERIREIAASDGSRQHSLLETLVRHTHGILDVFLAILSAYRHMDEAMVRLTLQGIELLGYPHNAPAIRWVLSVLIDEQAPFQEETLHEALHIVAAMEVEFVLPYLLAAFLNEKKDTQKWNRVVNRMCWIVGHDPRWAIACSPAVATLLASMNTSLDEQKRPDPAMVLYVLERSIPTCTYAIPALAEFARRKQGTEHGQQALRLLHAFDEVDLEPYQNYLRWSLES